MYKKVYETVITYTWHVHVLKLWTLERINGLDTYSLVLVNHRYLHISIRSSICLWCYEERRLHLSRWAQPCPRLCRTWAGSSSGCRRWAPTSASRTPRSPLPLHPSARPWCQRPRSHESHGAPTLVSSESIRPASRGRWNCSDRPTGTGAPGRSYPYPPSRRITRDPCDTLTPALNTTLNGPTDRHYTTRCWKPPKCSSYPVARHVRNDDLDWHEWQQRLQVGGMDRSTPEFTFCSKYYTSFSLYNWTVTTSN